MTKRVANKDARACVINFEEFEGSNTFAEWIRYPKEPERYVVYSYGRHWPLFIYVDGKWYENAGKYSRTTSKHHGQLHPLCETEKHGAEDMVHIAYSGVAGWMQRKLRAA